MPNRLEKTNYDWKLTGEQFLFYWINGDQLITSTIIEDAKF